MSNTTQENHETEHCYVEVGGDLLSKPSSLSDFLEQLGFPTAIIFCNTPSDTDLLEVLLKKRGIPATKLIGYVPPQKLERTLERLHAKEISTVVVTDIAARNINLAEFDIVVNYSIQNDGEIYLQRAGVSQGNNNETTAGAEAPPARFPAKRIVSLVGPLDIANFHFLKKAANVEFTKLDPPSKQEILAARVRHIGQKAATSQIASDENYRAMAQQVLEHEQREAMVAFLLQSAVELVPQLSSDLEKAISERDAFSMDDGVQPGAFQPGQRWQGGDDDRRGGGQGQRGGRDDGRGGRGRGPREGGGNFDGGRGGGQSRDSRGSNQRFDDRNFDSNEGGYNRSGGSDDNRSNFNDGDRSARGGGGRGDSGPRRDDRRDDRRGDSRRDDSRRDDRRNDRRDDRRDREDSRPPRNITRIKDDRIYIGLGARDGFTQEQFVDLIQQEGVTPDLLKKFSLRENYSFADLPEEQSAKVLEALKEKEVGGKKLFITKAVTLTTTIELPPEEGFADDQGEGEQAHGSGDTGEHGTSEAEGEESSDSPQTLEDSYR